MNSTEEKSMLKDAIVTEWSDYKTLIQRYTNL